jgi:hypothetical protein
METHDRWIGTLAKTTTESVGQTAGVRALIEAALHGAYRAGQDAAKAAQAETAEGKTLTEWAREMAVVTEVAIEEAHGPSERRRQLERTIQQAYREGWQREMGKPVDPDAHQTEDEATE